MLHALRSKRNITQREFVDATSRTYLSKLESGKFSITLDKLEKLSERLELSPLAFFALTVSKEAGEPAVVLATRLIDEICALASDGDQPGLDALKAELRLVNDLRAVPRAPSQHTGCSVQAGAAGQTELPF